MRQTWVRHGSCRHADVYHRVSSVGIWYRVTFAAFCGWLSFLKPCLHNTTCCQTGLTTGCIVYTNIHPVVKPVWQPAISYIQPVVKPVVQPGLTTSWTNSCSFNTVERTVLFIQHGCQTGFDNRLNEQWLFVQHGCQTGCKTGCATGLTTGLTTGCIV